MKRLCLGNLDIDIESDDVRQLELVGEYIDFVEHRSQSHDNRPNLWKLKSLFGYTKNEAFEKHAIESVGRVLEKKQGFTYRLFEVEGVKMALMADDGYQGNPHLIVVEDHEITIYNFGKIENQLVNLVRVLRELVLRMAENEGGICLHAACVEYQGKGIVIIGDSGSGKSTTMLNFLNNGADFISNDRCIIDQQLNILTWPFSCRIGSGTLSTFFDDVSDLPFRSDTPKGFSRDFQQKRSKQKQWGSKIKATFTPRKLSEMFGAKVKNTSVVDTVIFPNLSLESSSESLTRVNTFPRELVERNTFTIGGCEYNRNWLGLDKSQSWQRVKSAHIIMEQLSLVDSFFYISKPNIFFLPVKNNEK